MKTRNLSYSILSSDSPAELAKFDSNSNIKQTLIDTPSSISILAGTSLLAQQTPIDNAAIRKRIGEMRKRARILHEKQRSLNQNSSELLTDDLGDLYDELSNYTTADNSIASSGKQSNRKVNNSKLYLFPLNSMSNINFLLENDSILFDSEYSAKANNALPVQMAKDLTNNKMNANQLSPIKKQPHSSRKRHHCCEEKNNMEHKRAKCEACQVLTRPRPALTRQTASLTFIGDLATTSTPTKTKPTIASTPKSRDHDPSKHHPTQTIRNKHIKQLQVTEKRIKKRKQNQQQIKVIKYEKGVEQPQFTSLDKYIQVGIQQAKEKLTVIGGKKRMMSERELAPCRCCTEKQMAVVKKGRYSIEPACNNNNKPVALRKATCNLCDLSEFVVSTILENNSSDEISFIRSDVMMLGMVKKKSGSASKQRSSVAAATTTTTTTTRTACAYKKRSRKATTFDNLHKITLKDLMYTPSKLRHVEASASTVLPVKQQHNPVKSSKVYYL